MQILTDFPGANIRLLAQEGNTFHLTPDLRDSSDWFYWAFHVHGEPGDTFSCDFGSDKIGYYGPAVSSDRLTWHWLGKNFSEHGFSYTFGENETDVWLAHHILYPLSRFTDFCTEHHLSPEILTVSERGREVPFLRIGTGKRAVFVTARHHACESTGSYVLEGFLGQWLRSPVPGVTLLVVPFVDYDGVVDGDQGKGRHPHDHNQDYVPEKVSRYAAVRAIRVLAEEYAVLYALDFHSPWHKGGENDTLFLPYKSKDNLPCLQAFSHLVQDLCDSADALPHRAEDDFLPDVKWNRAGAPTCGYYMHANAGALLSSAVETPYFTARGIAFTPERALNTGAAFASALLAYHEKIQESDGQTGRKTL